MNENQTIDQFDYPGPVQTPGSIYCSSLHNDFRYFGISFRVLRTIRLKRPLPVNSTCVLSLKCLHPLHWLSKEMIGGNGLISIGQFITVSKRQQPLHPSQFSSLMHVPESSSGFLSQRTMDRDQSRLNRKCNNDNEDQPLDRNTPSKKWIRHREAWKSSPLSVRPRESAGFQHLWKGIVLPTIAPMVCLLGSVSDRL
jgi:hypothetical protein